MRHLRRIMRLHHEGTSAREIARSVGVARSTVQDALKRVAAAKLTWPLPDDVSDEDLEGRLFARPGGGVGSGARKRPEPDWGHLVRELRRPAGHPQKPVDLLSRRSGLMVMPVVGR